MSSLILVPRESVTWHDRVHRKQLPGCDDAVKYTPASVTVSGNRDTSLRGSINAEEIQLGLIRCDPGTLLLLGVTWEKFPPSSKLEVGFLDVCGLLESGFIGPVTWNRVWRADLGSTGFAFAGGREIWAAPAGSVTTGHWATVTDEGGKPPYPVKSWRELLGQ